MPEPMTRVPAVTVEQMIDVDRWTIEAGISLLQMMENAGRAVALSAATRLRAEGATGRVVVLAGSGGNGGGGMVAARRLALWGWPVSVHLTRHPAALSGAAAHQARALESVGVPLRPPGEALVLSAGDVVVDALVGYSLRGAPSGEVARLVEALAGLRGAVTVIALDVPTGLDPDTGHASDVTVRADLTVTLALPKTGLLTDGAREWVGDLWLADISVPPSVLERAGVSPGRPFAEGDLVRLPVR